MLVQRGLGNFVAQVLADGFEHVASAGRHHRGDAALPEAAAGQDRHHGDQQHAREREHGDLIREQGDHAVRRQGTEMRRPLDQRMLNDVLERVLGVAGRRGVVFRVCGFVCGLGGHDRSRIANFTSNGSKTT